MLKITYFHPNFKNFHHKNTIYDKKNLKYKFKLPIMSVKTQTK